MRILNTNETTKKSFSKFELPGFRSGSIVKKFIAIMYYVFVVVFMINMVHQYSKGDFTSWVDIVAFVNMMVLFLLVFLTPVICVGMSNHYDLHGIKLFLAIMVPLCLIITLNNFNMSLFSKEYIESISKDTIVTDTLSDSSAQSDISIDKEIIDKEKDK